MSGLGRGHVLQAGGWQAVLCCAMCAVFKGVCALCVGSDCSVYASLWIAMCVLGTVCTTLVLGCNAVVPYFLLGVSAYYSQMWVGWGLVYSRGVCSPPTSDGCVLVLWPVTGG